MPLVGIRAGVSGDWYPYRDPVSLKYAEQFRYIQPPDALGQYVKQHAVPL